MLQRFLENDQNKKSQVIDVTRSRCDVTDLLIGVNIIPWPCSVWSAAHCRVYRSVVYCFGYKQFGCYILADDRLLDGGHSNQKYHEIWMMILIGLQTTSKELFVFVLYNMKNKGFFLSWWCQGIRAICCLYSTRQGRGPRTCWCDLSVTSVLQP